MTRQSRKEQRFGSLFEEDYLVRTLGRIAHDPEIAPTELVANAWDAGASLVDLTIPSVRETTLVIKDDVHGMTEQQFKSRWMTLGYDRVKHQGKNVEFPVERKEWRRKAYGRNGVGRHGLLYFADSYLVETRCDHKGTPFEIGTQSRDNPFRIEKKTSFIRQGSGTILSVTVSRHLPKPERIREILSARFLHDPQFVVRVNGLSVSLADQSGLIERCELSISGQPSAISGAYLTARVMGRASQAALALPNPAGSPEQGGIDR